MKLQSNEELIKVPSERLFGYLSTLCDTSSQAFQELNKVADVKPETDGFSFAIANMFNCRLRLLEAKPNSMVSYHLDTDKSISATASFTMQDDGPDTRLQLAVDADVPFLLKAMIEKPLQQGIGQMMAKIKELAEQQL